MPLNTEPRVAAPDNLYAALVDMHEGLSCEESARAMARLIFILCNHIGDDDVIAEAIALARATVGSALEHG